MKNNQFLMNAVVFKANVLRQISATTFSVCKINTNVPRALSYTIYLEIGLSTSRCPRKHGGCDVTGVKLGYGVHAVNH